MMPLRKCNFFASHFHVQVYIPTFTSKEGVVVFQAMLKANTVLSFSIERMFNNLGSRSADALFYWTSKKQKTPPKKQTNKQR